MEFRYYFTVRYTTGRVIQNWMFAAHTAAFWHALATTYGGDMGVASMHLDRIVAEE